MTNACIKLRRFWTRQILLKAYSIAKITNIAAINRKNVPGTDNVLVWSMKVCSCCCTTWATEATKLLNTNSWILFPKPWNTGNAAKTERLTVISGTIDNKLIYARAAACIGIASRKKRATTAQQNRHPCLNIYNPHNEGYTITLT